MSQSNKNKRNKKKAIGNINGQGGYYSDKVVPFMSKIIPDGTFAKAGGRAGAILGSGTGVSGLGLFGKSAGTYLGGKLSKLLGFGDYTVQSNSLMNQGMAVPEGQQIPSFGVLGHETRVCHREYVGDIYAPAVPSAFTNASFSINAGNASLFPWLAPIATNYQQYKFNGLVFEYRTLSSDITAGGSLGAVILATNYDVIDTVYSSKLAMENSQYAVSAKPSVSQLHAIECDPSLSASKLWYVRSNTAPVSSTDNRFYDLGKFQVATQGLPSAAGTVLGELWASYDVSLYKPEIGAPVGSATQHVVAATNVSVTNMYGDAPLSTGDSLFTASGNTLTFFNPGTYVINTTINGVSLSGVPAFSGTGTSTLVDLPGPRPGTIAHFSLIYTVTTSSRNQTSIINWTGALTSLSSTVTNATPCTSLFA